MKLIRHGPPGAEKPGLVDIDGQLRDLSGHVRDVTGSVLDDRSLDRLRDVDPQSLPLVARDSRLGPCVGEVGKVVCVGLNYSDHAAETGAPTPKEPILFFKATSAISGPNDSVMIPRDSLRTDWEVELGIVIGSEVRYVEEADALSHVAGYCVVNDVSERDFQTKRGGQWVKGKSADTFCPLGPWLVTRDEVPDPQGLDMWLDVNGERRQDSSTSNMIFSAAFLVSYISRFMSLQAGDVIATGTPAGVGMGRNPQVWLAAGQTMRLGIQGLGEQRQLVVAWPG
ncbi:MAG: fumarylacetoacetate hydrolase family protein [Rhodobacteraceae bacterium]|nr:fumarylacetoacetate hydrolase family protein [Paracoccaceae bacterium]